MIYYLGLKSCQNPRIAIQQPKNSKSVRYINPYRWRQNFQIAYRCNPGYRFHDGVETKYTKCVFNKYHGLHWSIREFPDCLG